MRRAWLTTARKLEAIADVLRDLVLTTPPNAVAGSWREALPELLRAAKVGGRLRTLDMGLRRELLALFAMSAGDYLDGWFESDPIKAVYGFDGIVGNYASPYTPGSAYVLLHHVFGEVNGKHGAWGHAIGGMGAITQAMASAARARGVEIRVGTPVREVLVEGGRAVGVVTESGETLRAAAVISNLNPKLLYSKLIAPAALPAEFREHMSHWRCGSGTFRMNVALTELPDFTCLPGKAPADHHTAGIIIAPTLGYMERAYFDARDAAAGRAQPIVELVIPSTLDDSPRPAGQHVASLFCQHVAPQLPNGESWDAHRDTVADLMIETVNAHAPNFKAAMLGRQIMSPLDLERTFGLVGGDIFHGVLSLDQLFSARPMLGYGNYRGPLRGCTCAAPARTRAAASPARRATTRRARSSAIFAAGGCAGWHDRRAAKQPSKVRMPLRAAEKTSPAPGKPRFVRQLPEQRRQALIVATIECLKRYGHDGPLDPHHQHRRPGYRSDSSTTIFPTRTSSSRPPTATSTASWWRGLQAAVAGAAAAPRARLRAFFAPCSRPPNLDRTCWRCGWCSGACTATRASSSACITRPTRATCSWCAGCWRALVKQERPHAKVDLRLAAIGLKALLDGLWLE